MRALLNPRAGHQTTAAIVAEIQNLAGKEYDPDPHETYVAAPAYVLQISNCDRSIAFEFGFYDRDTREGNIEKVDLMIEALQKFRRGLVIETKRYEARLAKCQANDD